MPASDPRRVVLDLVPGPGPIAGSVREGDGPPRPFTGWLELCALLDQARVIATADPGDR